MQFAVDFHIHTALSPCGDDDMTPNNIVNMALLKGLDIIAITDHNSGKNLEAVMAVCRKNGIMFVPGIEVQTKEEVHVICLFKKVENAVAFGELIDKALPDIKNNEVVFGSQLIYDEQDEIVGKVDKMLLSSVNLSIGEVFNKVRAFGGICIPAHVDRSAYSIVSNLGFIPQELGVKTIEISKKNPPKKVIQKFPFLKPYNYIISSDAHYLWDISEREHFIELDFLSITELFKVLA